MNADDLSALLNALVKEGRPRDAEDLLFSQYEKQPSGEVYEAGLEAFEQLERLSDGKLNACGYSRAEIGQARRDFDRLAKKN